jgi:hypothetical protein
MAVVTGATSQMISLTTKYYSDKKLLEINTMRLLDYLISVIFSSMKY